MTRSQNTQLEDEISRVLPNELIRRWAGECGVVQRARKLDIVTLVQAIVLGFGVGRSRSLEGIRRVYQSLAGHSLARSSFHKRFNSRFTRLLEFLVWRGLEQEQGPCSKSFESFREVLAIDSCVLKLHDSLSSHFAGTWHPSAAKLTAIINVTGRSLRGLSLSDGRTSDIWLLKPGSWVRGRLLIFDLGFYKTLLFRQIRDCGGYFLSRAKPNANMRICASHLEQHRHLVGLKLKEAIASMNCQYFDFDVEAGFYDYSKSPALRVTPFRFIGDRNAESGSFHCYITNAPAEMISMKSARSTYAARWEIELLFREMQSDFRLNQFPSRNQHIVQALIYAAVLTLLVSRRLHEAVRKRLNINPARLPKDRWSRVFTAVVPQLLTLLRFPDLPELSRSIFEHLCREGPDPNRKRVPLGASLRNQAAFA